MILRFSARRLVEPGVRRSRPSRSRRRCACTASLAPPCSGPLRRADGADDRRVRGRLSVDAITRAVKVEALKECSAYRIIERLKASTTTSSASSPKVIHRKFADVVEIVARRERLAGHAGGAGRRRRSPGAPRTADARARFSSSCRSRRAPSPSRRGRGAPMRLTAVRSTSIGCASSGTQVDRGAHVAGERRGTHARSRAAAPARTSVGSSPFHSRYATASNGCVAASSCTG